MRGDRLRFIEEPRTAVRFPGNGQRMSTSTSDRTHLPDTVVPGQEYRDVTVAYRLETRLMGVPDEGGRVGAGEDAGGDRDADG